MAAKENMIGRHQLRAKTLQALYACESHPEDEQNIKKQLFKSIESIYDLYISLFSILIALKERAAEKLEIGKNKRLPTEKDLNPNTAFLDNAVLNLLEKNSEIKNYLEKNHQLMWHADDIEIVKLFNEIQAGEEYQGYINKESHSFSGDKKFILDLFQKYIATNPLILDVLEDKNMHWADDIDIANSMVFATLESFTKKSDERLSLYKIYKSPDDKIFVENLFDRTRSNWDFLQKIIQENALNWDLERIARIDKILLQMALCEIFFFLDIPQKVSINEYIDLSKDYSSEKSRIFINGILDKVIKSQPTG